MTKTASIRTIEQTIESLPQADQFKLLEKLLKHLKQSFTGGTLLSSAVAMPSSDTQKTLRGALKQYADVSRWDAEKNAFAKAMKAKHADN